MLNWESSTVSFLLLVLRILGIRLLPPDVRLEDSSCCSKLIVRQKDQQIIIDKDPLGKSSGRSSHTDTYPLTQNFKATF